MPNFWEYSPRNRKKLEPKDVKRDYGTHDRRNVRARQRAIGRELRRRFDDIVQEPVPEDMLDILRAIDAKGAGK